MALPCRRPPRRYTVATVSEQPKIHPFREALVKLVAAALILYGLATLAEAFSGDHGALHASYTVVKALWRIGIGIGLLRFQGWAFVLFSLLLIVRWFVAFTSMVVRFDAGGFSAGAPLLGWVVAITLLIAVFSRWSMERHFRPDTGARP